MSELDLTAAVVAAKEALRGYTGDCICDEAYTSRRLVDPSCSYHDMEGVDDAILIAALPLILEALAKVADAEVDDAGQFANRWARDAAAAARWLTKITKAAP